MRLVMKFGGTAVDSGKKIVHITNLIKSYHDKGNEIIGVFSAVTGMTDEILNVSGYVLKRDKRKIKDFINKTVSKIKITKPRQSK
jgi:aspartate kinase